MVQIQSEDSTPVIANTVAPPTMSQELKKSGSDQNGHSSSTASEVNNGSHFHQDVVSNSTLNASVPAFAPPQQHPYYMQQYYYNGQYYLAPLSIIPPSMESYGAAAEGEAMAHNPSQATPVSYEVGHPNGGYSHPQGYPMVPGGPIHPTHPIGLPGVAMYNPAAVTYSYQQPHMYEGYYNVEGAEEDSDGKPKRWMTAPSPTSPPNAYHGDTYGVPGAKPMAPPAGYSMPKHQRQNSGQMVNTPILQVQNSYVNLNLHNPPYSYSAAMPSPQGGAMAASSHTQHPPPGYTVSNGTHQVIQSSAYDHHHMRASSEQPDQRRSSSYSGSRGRGLPMGRGGMGTNSRRGMRRSESERHSCSSDHGVDGSSYMYPQKNAPYIPPYTHMGATSDFDGGPIIVPPRPTVMYPNQHHDTSNPYMAMTNPSRLPLMYPSVPPPQVGASSVPPQQQFQYANGHGYKGPVATTSAETAFNGTVVNSEPVAEERSEVYVQSEANTENGVYENVNSSSYPPVSNDDVNICDSGDASTVHNKDVNSGDSTVHHSEGEDLPQIQLLQINSNETNGLTSPTSVNNNNEIDLITVEENSRKIINVSNDELKANWDFPFKFGDILDQTVLEDLTKPKNEGASSLSSSTKCGGVKRRAVFKPVFDSQHTSSTDYSFLSEEDAALIRGVRGNDEAVAVVKQVEAPETIKPAETVKPTEVKLTETIKVTDKTKKAAESTVTTSEKKVAHKVSKVEVVAEVATRTRTNSAESVKATKEVRKVDQEQKVAPKVTEKVPVKRTVTPVAKETKSGPSVWGKQKNWGEQFKTNKKVATVAPFNCSDDLSNEQQMDCVDTETFPALGQAAEGRRHPNEPDSVDKKKLADYMMSYAGKYESPALQPRGLTNKQYWCFVNSVLQAFASIPQMVNFFRDFEEKMAHCINPKTAPYLFSMLSFFNELSDMNMSAMNQTVRSTKHNNANVVNLPEIHFGDPFEPTKVQKVLLESKNFQEGYQHDAEEMLSHMLNCIHDEIIDCCKLLEDKRKAPVAVAPVTNGHMEDDGDEWVTKWSKNKSCITRTTKVDESPISKIFWGVTRSLVKKGNGTPTANLEPFVTLPLDIQDEKVSSVKDALEQCLSKTDVVGFTCNDTQQELPVSNHRLLEELPEVLILQLKRFVYLEKGGLQKVVKDITMSVDLDITKELMSAQAKKNHANEKSRYKLVSVVYHDGKDANKGHYISDVYHAGYKCWLNYDDACVKAATSGEMQTRLPYLLFYRREDTFPSKNFPLNPYARKRTNKGGEKKAAAVVVVGGEEEKKVEEEKSETGVIKNEKKNKANQNGKNNNNNKKQETGKKNKRGGRN